MAKYALKDKEAYLNYNKKEKKAGRKPKTFAAWLKGRTKGSAQTKSQMRSVSGDDYRELSRLMDKK